VIGHIRAFCVSITGTFGGQITLFPVSQYALMMWYSPAHLQTLICLPSSDDKFACEISLSDLPNFFDPAFKPKILDSAEIVDFHVMRIH